MTDDNGTTTEPKKLIVFEPTTIPDAKTHARCLTGPSGSGWKVAFYLPIIVDAAESIKRFGTDIEGMIRKGLNVVGHGIKSADLFADKDALKPDKTPTNATIKKIQDMAQLLVIGRSGPTKVEKVRQQAKDDAKTDMLAEYGVGSMDELKKLVDIAKKRMGK